MNTPRMPHSRYVKELLGLGSKLPTNGTEDKDVDIAANEGDVQRVLRFRVMSAEEADAWSRQFVGNKTPGRGRPRIFAQCDYCGQWVSAGRFNQHHRVHPKEVD